MITNTSVVSKRIKFFTFHGCIEQGRQRKNSPAADTKTDYIVDVLNRIGYGVDVISRAVSDEDYCLPASIEYAGNNTLRYFASLGKTRSLLRFVNRCWVKIQFFIWCLKNLEDGEQVIVYHSLGFDSTFLKLVRLRNIRIIGEIEEIYQDVIKQTPFICRNEYKFIDACCKYIFPTHLLDEKLNKSSKPSLVIHGVYASESIVEEKFSDGKIHVVYGGTLDPNKGGAIAAAAAEFLPSNYHIHICGFGDPSEMKRVVEDVQSRSVASVSFDGELIGDDYKHFIQKCHIGLSTQNPDAAFNSTSFPSKILMYLSNGLKVVSIDIPAIAFSTVADNIFFYKRQSPKEIANAIIIAGQHDRQTSSVLSKLDSDFEQELNRLLLQ